MAVTLAFDVYGTLIDPHAVIGTLEGRIGDQAPRFDGSSAGQLEGDYV